MTIHTLCIATETSIIILGWPWHIRAMLWLPAERSQDRGSKSLLAEELMWNHWQSHCVHQGIMIWMDDDGEAIAIVMNSWKRSRTGRRENVHACEFRSATHMRVNHQRTCFLRQQRCSPVWDRKHRLYYPSEYNSNTRRGGSYAVINSSSWAFRAAWQISDEIGRVCVGWKRYRRAYGLLARKSRRQCTKAIPSKKCAG
jgi:hypothetical protein